MDDHQKPFACNVPGCGQSFTNEDHLNVHTKKHDMILNLGIGNKSNVFVADQTPTPTRFIRTCDEVGLFDDIVHLNPFEQTFRRAVEEKKTHEVNSTALGSSISSVQSSQPCDNTLHTPHICLPYHSEEPPKLIVEKPEVPKLAVPVEPPRTLKLNLKTEIKEKPQEVHLIPSKLKRQQIEIKNYSTNCSELDYKTVESRISRPIKILPKHDNNITIPGLTLHSANIVIPISSQPIIMTETSIKEKLKAVILKNSSPTQLVPGAAQIKQPAVISPALNSPTLTAAPAAKQRKKIKSRKLEPIKLGQVKNDDCSPKQQSTKKRNMTEGNREAAKRYRNRMKLKHESIQNRNECLADENRQLRAEVKQLKQILALHQFCTVSQQQTISIQGIIEAPKGKIACPCDTPCNIKCEDSASN